MNGLDRHMDRNVVARLRGKLDVPPEVLDSTLEGPRFQDSRETQGAPITSEAGLMTALIRRLRDLEADAKAKAATFQQVHIDKKKLEDKVRDLQERLASAHTAGDAAESSSNTEQTIIAGLRAENGRLRRELNVAWGQVRDIKKFLNDYGMVWVGEDDPGKYVEVEGGGNAMPASVRDDPRARPSEEKGKSTVASLGLDVKALERHVARLNLQTGQSAPTVPLTLYQDGLQLHVFPFQPFSDISSRALLQDILDGYHPFQLREDFPDGANLVLIDKTDLSFGDAPVPGLSRASDASAAQSQQGNVRSMGDLGKPRALTKEEYLKRLPQTVIKNGKVVPVRSGVEEVLSGKARPPLPRRDGASHGAFDAMLDTPAIHQLLAARRPMKQGAGARLLSGDDSNFHMPFAEEERGGALSEAASSLATSRRQSQDGNVEGIAPDQSATVQVKNADGQVLVFKLSATSTIGALHAKIARFRSGTAFEIRSAFPARAYTDFAATLAEAGLVPSATLFVKGL